jgi:hypothetical protein
VLGGCQLHIGIETQLGAKLKRQEYADDDKTWEKRDGM